MFINYSLIIGLMIFITNRYTRNYYLKKEIRLAQINKRKLEIKEFERKQEMINIENEKLQQDVESKSRELAVSTMSMIKKNQFLSKIKDDLKKLTDLQKIKNVIKTIDRNLNNEDDWKFFEKTTCKWFEEGVSMITIDLLIGETQYVGKGLASKMINDFINFACQDVDKILIDPETANKKAVHVYEKCGFTKVEQFINYAKDHWMMHLERKNQGSTN